MLFGSPEVVFPSRMFRLLLLCLALLCGGMNSHGGVASYTERGKIDFDQALQLLNPYGTWARVDGQWVYTPLDHEAPYTNGRWLYTEYGWYWKGNHPHSWLTEHYGYWRRGADKVWVWYPGPDWLSEIVEFRATATHIGWRSGAVDRNGEYIESPDDRYAKGDEWTFVTKEQFAGPITPGMVAKPDAATRLLIDSTDCVHAYLTYRPIDRPGPHPADFIALNKDGGMFSPQQNQEIPASPFRPGLAPSVVTTNAPAARTAATNAPALAGTGADADTQVDKRQVKYWVTMSLPTYWTPRPADAKPEEIYMYRPDFFQDSDGISRRITVWFNPSAKASLKDIFAGRAEDTKTSPVSPALPATPAAPAKAQDPFRSPLDAPYHATHAQNSSNESKPGATNAPSGLVSPPKGK